MEHCRVTKFSQLLISTLRDSGGGGELNFPFVGSNSVLLEQHKILLVYESERLEVETTTSLKELFPFSPELGMGLFSGIGAVKPCRNREKFKDSEFGSASFEACLKKKGGENNRRRM